MNPDGPADELLPPDAGAAVRPDRRQRRIAFWCGVMIVVAAAGMIWRRCSDRMWPPLAAPGDALGIVIDREGLLPEGATWRGSGKAWALRVFGVTSSAAQDRLADAARREVQQRGGPRGFDRLEIEFWSGGPPPKDANAGTEEPAPGRALLRTIDIR